MLGDESWSEYVRCDECGIKLETDRCGYETSEEAMKTIAKQWNTRAERTCQNVGYYIDSTRFKCSECGYNGWTKWAKDGNDRVPNYCPNCGARVVKQ